ncbi:MAG: homoserine O-acetyltransferase [Saprospiraceae bacterium]
MKSSNKVGDFDLELGGVIKDVNILYHTYGDLNEDKDNVIVVIHALTASSDMADWWKGLYGPGNFFDPEKYFIICANNLGSPYGTTCADDINPDTGSRYGLDFPKVTIRDTARLHLILLKDLGIEKVKFIIGGSCGGNIAQEMAIINPSAIESLILLCCSAQETPWVIAIHESQRMAMHVDSSFHVNNTIAGKEGLRAARAMALPYYRSHTSFVKQQSEDSIFKINNFKAASYIKYQGEKFVKRFNSHCYYTLLNVLDTHNVGRGRESIIKALRQIKAKTLVIGFDSDLLIPIKEQKFLAEHIPNAAYAEISTIFGHDAFLIETDLIKAKIREKFV